jgi:hypothetical protein
MKMQMYMAWKSIVLFSFNLLKQTSPGDEIQNSSKLNGSILLPNIILKLSFELMQYKLEFTYHIDASC